MIHKPTLPQNDPANNSQPTPNSNRDADFKTADLERSPEPGAASGPDPFDVAALRLEPSLTAAANVKKALLTLKVGKPDPSWWVRVHPDPSYRIPTAVLEEKGESKMGVEVYLIPRNLQGDLATEPCFRPCILALAVTRQGDPFLWRVNLPRDGDRSNAWSDTAKEAMERATRHWIRFAANMRAGAYDVWEAAANLPEPTWPDQTFPQLLKIAFKDRYITDLNHPVLRRLRGEV
jgi:hypothetical protein